jgi:predicted AAA+ superfamily ATPase
MIRRDIQDHLLSLATQFPAVAVMGPRQSGKTTLVKQVFLEYAYVTLEDIDKKLAAREDPRDFLSLYKNKKGLIIDEVQEVPELLSYMQGIIDQGYRPGFFILTGSQHFLMYEQITQTLAGRIALLTLLPLSVHELNSAHLVSSTCDELLLKGFYPRLYAQNINVRDWCMNYISNYVEKDVRAVLGITDVIAFQRFLKMCAARVGNLINYSDLARDCDISPNTAKAWLSVLETSFIIKLLPPYYKNFNKRVIKTPKLYFYDSALVCALLSIRTVEELSLHPLRGALFESFAISEMFKYSFNNNEQPAIYFWRDVQGHEIDAIIEKSFNVVVPVEIKPRKTIINDFFKGLLDWSSIIEQQDIPSYVIYAGDENMKYKKGHIFPWFAINDLLAEIYKK